MKRKIVVLGGGISGYGSAILAKKKGFDVFLSDMGKIAPKFRERLDEWKVEYEEGQHTEERILDANEVVKSPGIPDTAPIVKRIRERGIPVISEIEFAGRYKGVAKTICITGSNGKTTTTSLIYKIMRDAGRKVSLIHPLRGDKRAFCEMVAENAAQQAQRQQNCRKKLPNSFHQMTSSCTCVHTLLY